MPAPHRKGVLRYLIEDRLSEDLIAWIRARRSDGKTWEAIAEELSHRLQLPAEVTQVSRQTVRQWISRDDAIRAGRPEPADEADGEEE